jgi:hypothetical protein
MSNIGSRLSAFATLVVVLGSVHLTRATLADGKPLPAGTYEVRLTDESPKPAVGQTMESERWVEFVRAGKVVGREVASVVPAAQLTARSAQASPMANRSRVDTLKGGDYVRIWINKASTHYLINLVTAQ